MVAGARIASVDLFLCPLRLCQYYGACDGNVCAFSDCDNGRRNSALFGCTFFGLLFQSWRFTHSLWDHPRADLLWRRLHNATNVVDPGVDYVRGNDRYLECGWFHLVESSSTLVKTWQDTLQQR